MLYGYNGSIMRVNLSQKSISIEQPEEAFYRTYYGGWGFVAYYLLRELEPGIDPLGPENRLIIALGPVTGMPLGGSGRNAIGAKSPLTGGFGEADVGGFFGAELKRAGFDGIVVEGKAESPVYLWVHDGEAEIRDAVHLWGKTTGQVQATIREELSDRRIRTCLIGEGGERMVRYACVLNDLNHAAGRSGLGAVMGSKLFKGIVARGRNVPPMAEPDVVRDLARWLRANVEELHGNLSRYGMGAGMVGMSERGGLPTRNFREGTFEGVDKIDAKTLAETIGAGMESCYACPIHCKKTVQVEEPYAIDPMYGGPEYEALASLGSLCGVDDLVAISKANELCNAYSLDAISAGVSIAFAMECFERGLITKEDTGGLRLHFGNGQALVELVEKTAHREGFGDLVAEGVRRMAEKIGKGSEAFAVHIKGQEAPMHDPRARSPVLGLGYALSPTGADHVHVTTNTVFKNCAGLCAVPRYSDEQLVDMIRAVTGWQVSVYELERVGQRAMDMARAFNGREGFAAEDDRMAPRFTSPFESGPLAGSRIEEGDLESMKRNHYRIMGWDVNTGVPTAARLEDMGIGWVAEELARSRAANWRESR
jgi:aldehyde:ferredoxin oxidoreductase